MYNTTETNYSRRDVLKLGVAGLAGLLGVSARADEKDGSPNGHIVFYDPKAKAIKVIDGNEAISPKTLDKIVKKVDLDVAELKEMRPTHDANEIFILYSNSKNEDAIASIKLSKATGEVIYQGKADEISSIRLATGNNRGVEFERLFYATPESKFYEVNMTDKTSEEVDEDDQDLKGLKKNKWKGTPGTRWSPKEVHVVDEYPNGEEVKGVYAVEVKDGKANVTVKRENKETKPVLRTFDFTGESWQLIWMHPDNR